VAGQDKMMACQEEFKKKVMSVGQEQLVVNHEDLKRDMHARQ
jgi:hypothetical protein